MYETGPQVLSPVRKPNQVDTVTWNVTRAIRICLFLFKTSPRPPQSPLPVLYIILLQSILSNTAFEERSQAVVILLGDLGVSISAEIVCAHYVQFTWGVHCVRYIGYDAFGFISMTFCVSMLMRRNLFVMQLIQKKMQVYPGRNRPFYAHLWNDFFIIKRPFYD